MQEKARRRRENQERQLLFRLRSIVKLLSISKRSEQCYYSSAQTLFLAVPVVFVSLKDKDKGINYTTLDSY